MTFGINFTPVKLGAFDGVFQQFKSAADLFETRLSLRISGISVRMILFSQLTKGLLHLIGTGLTGNTQFLIRVFCHLYAIQKA